MNFMKKINDETFNEIIAYLEEQKKILENQIDIRSLDIILNVDKYSKKNHVKKINSINKILYEMREKNEISK